MLMAPAGARPRGRPAHVRRRDGLAPALGTGAVTAFNFAFTLLQIPIGVIGVPLGVVLLPSLVARGRDRRP